MDRLSDEDPMETDTKAAKDEATSFTDISLGYLKEMEGRLHHYKSLYQTTSKVGIYPDNVFVHLYFSRAYSIQYYFAFCRETGFFRDHFSLQMQLLSLSSRSFEITTVKNMKPI